MNRIVERFARLKGVGQKGFIVYLGAGDPNPEATRQLALAFDKLGVRGCGWRVASRLREWPARPGKSFTRETLQGIEMGRTR